MERKEIYKCDVCGKVSEILTPASLETVCCGQPMKLMVEQTADWKGEKHVPKITVEHSNGKYRVTVDVGISMGTPHPMTEEHYIMWVEIICKDGCSERRFLKPGDEPKGTFTVSSVDGLWAREYCNIHGLWSYKP